MLPNLDLVLLIGLYAQRWHLGARNKKTLTETVSNWPQYLKRAGDGPRFLPLPHPSWRNNRWLKQNPWFDDQLVPVLRTEVRRLIAPPKQPLKSAQRSG